MRLVIDLQGAQTASRLRGIGRYSLSLAKGLARNRGDHEIVVALSDAFPETIAPIRDALHGILPETAIRIWSAPGPIRFADLDNRARQARAEAIYSAFLESLEPDVILVASLFEGYGDDAAATVKGLNHDIPTAVVHYDLIPFHDPDRYIKANPGTEAFFDTRFKALKRADVLLPISEFSAKDAASFLGTDGREIVTIHAACSEGFTDQADDRSDWKRRVADLNIHDPYIIASGTIEPHKNLITLFKAFSKLPQPLRETHRIVLIGHADAGQEAILRDMAQKAGLPPEALIVTGYVSDETLAALYGEARLMVFPSMNEGFGLPPLEAMSCGTPTLGANATSVPEVIGLDEALFDPLDVAGLTELIVRALENGPFRDRLLANAAKQAKAFSWDRTATKALAACEALAARGTTVARPQNDILKSCATAIAGTTPDRHEMDALAAAMAFDFPEPNRKRRLFVDVSQLYSVDAKTGCQRVARSILIEWLANAPDDVIVEPVFARPDVLGYNFAWSYAEKLTGEPTAGNDTPIDYASGDVFFGLDLSPNVGVQNPWLKQMHARGVRVFFCVYDLLPIELPQHFDPRLVANFEEWLDAVTGFDGIIGISDATAQTFRDWRLANKHGARDDDAFIYAYSHLGADIENSAPTYGLPDSAEDVLATMAERPSFLMVSTIEPRKGQAAALDAIEAIWKRGRDVNFVLVGKQGWHVEDLAKRLRGHEEADARLHWLEGISDEYLTKIYQAATCVLVNSQAEGFGLSLIEAARHGVPLLVRDIPVFREIAGEHATYFSAVTAEAFADDLERWLDGYARGDIALSNDMPWMTWKQSADRMAQILLRSDGVE